MSNMLEIAILTSWNLDPAKGTGTAVALTGLAGGLEGLGHRVTFVRVPIRTPWMTINRIAYNATLPLRRRLAEYDLVVGSDLDGCLYRPARNQSYVVSLKGVLADEYTFDQGWARFSLWCQSRFERLNARRAHTVVCTSEYNRQIAAHAYGLDATGIAVVAEGIDLSVWDRLSGESPKNLAGRPTVLTVARMYTRKNIATLLAAAATVRQSVPNVHFRVVGGGPRLSALQQQLGRLDLHESVEILGEVPDSAAVRRAFVAADVFCLPSLQEGFGIVFLEAMAAGLPIVASRAAAVPEVMPDGKAGILVDPLDPDALAAALTRLLCDGALRARLGNYGRTYVRRYDWTRVALEFLRAVGFEDA
jgi:glycosyltransferase involved in cell wall biosynthesis